MERLSEGRSCANINVQRRIVTSSKAKSNGETKSGNERAPMGKQHKLLQRRRNNSFNFINSFFIVIYCSLFITSIQNFLLKDQHTSSSKSFIPFFTGADALAVRRIELRDEVTSGTSSQAILSPVVRSSFARSNHSRVEKQSSNASGGNGSTSSIVQKHGKSQQPLMRTKAMSGSDNSTAGDVSSDGASSDIASVPTQRWGHSVTYLKGAKIALFIGGVVPSGANETVLTNDVFALDMSINATQQWTHLISENLTAHAFAARAVAYDVNGTVERITIVGGSTDDCSANASQVFVWQMGESWQEGQWSVPEFDNSDDVPIRRRGMQAVQVPVQIGERGSNATELEREGGVSYMLLGGISDESTCSHASDLYPDVDIWTMGASTKGASQVIEPNSSFAMDTRTLMLAKQMTNVSLADYSSVVIPGEGSDSDRVLMLGGVDENGELTSFDEPWIYNFTSALWTRFATTNSSGNASDIPSGRVGHTATLTSNNTIIVYGGFTALSKDRKPSSDVHVLDLSSTPAVWSKVNTGAAPSRAFHTTFMTGDFMVVGFGITDDVSTDSNDSKANIDNGKILPTKRALNTTAYQPLQILDTANPNGWAWSDSLSEAVAARAKASVATSIVAKESAIRAAAAVASSSSAEASSTTAAASSKSSSSSHSATIRPTTSAATLSTPSASKLSAHSSNSKEMPTISASASQGLKSLPSTPDTTTFTNPFTSTASPTSTGNNDSGSTMTPATRNTAVIASVLGAAALAAGIGVLYAAYKRREANSRNEYDNRYDHYSHSQAGPPVSSLWLNQPATWAGTASKSLVHKASLASVALLNRGKDVTTPRAESILTTTPMNETYTSPFPVMSLRSANSVKKNQGFQPLRDLPASSRLSIRRNELREQEAIRNKLRGQEGRKSTLGYFPDEFTHHPISEEEGSDPFKDVSPRQTLAIPPVAFTRMSSSESLGSVGGASHMSYPYLGSMNNNHQNVITFGKGSPYSLQNEQLEPASPSYILESQANKAATLNEGGGFPFRSLIEENDQFSTGRPSVASSHAHSHYEEAMAAAEAAVAGRRDSRRPSAWMRQAMQTSLPPSEEGSPTLDPVDSTRSPAPLSIIQQDRRESRQSLLLRVVNEGKY